MTAGKGWRRGVVGRLYPERDMNVNGSLHHADDTMTCPVCCIPWPCAPYLEARLAAEWRGERPSVVFPERQS